MKNKNGMRVGTKQNKKYVAVFANHHHQQSMR